VADRTAGRAAKYRASTTGRTPATDDWRCDDWSSDGEFAVEFDRRDQSEAIL
jgi:hypothetical protein